MLDLILSLFVSTIVYAKEVEVERVILAEVTAYSAIDSCHTGPDCLMANGKRAEVGFLACPRKYALGAKFKLLDTVYECGDRTSIDYGERFDIFMGHTKESYDKAVEFGKQELSIIV